MHLIKNVRLDWNEIQFDLIAIVSQDRDLTHLMERLKVMLYTLKIDQTEFYFDIEEDKMEGKERLFDCKSMCKHYYGQKRQEEKREDEGEYGQQKQTKVDKKEKVFSKVFGVCYPGKRNQ